MLRLLPSAGLALIMLIPELVTFALTVGVSVCLLISTITGTIRWLRRNRGEYAADNPQPPALPELQPALQS